MQSTIKHETDKLSLSGIIQEKILDKGPISFHDFMEMALYHPNLGYYTSARQKIGAEGDFFTSPELTPLFGRMIARQLEEMWKLMGAGDFSIIEYGAGNGTLCSDILDYLKSNEKFYNKLQYYIIERSDEMIEREKKLDKVSWLKTINDVPVAIGCVLTNEVLDTFPVHKVTMVNELMEVYVDYRNGFTEISRPALAPIKDYLSELGIQIPKGTKTEINLDAIQWIKDIAAFLQKGFVLTIDYGYTLRKMHECMDNTGSLRCYHRHQRSFNPYIDIGNQDITSSVNFSALIHWGEKASLDFCGFTNQANFLISLGLEEYLKKFHNNVDKNILAFTLHTLLIDMGLKYKVLVQSKGLNAPKLTGLKFQQKI